MTWKTPKTDWTAADVPVPKDFNRIEGNTLDNHERLNGHDSDIANHNSRISANTNRLNGHDSDIANHNSRISANTNRLNGHDSDISSINSTLSSHNSRISSNASEINKIKNNVSVIKGTISDGNTLPLPSGFSASECFWIVSINRLDTFMDYAGDTPTRSQCYVDASRTVYIRATRERYGAQDPLIATGTANYLVIGVTK